MTTNIVPYLTKEYEHQKALFENQPTSVQRFLEGQAKTIADALVARSSQVRFTLPDRVFTQIAPVTEQAAIIIPESLRSIRVRGFLQRDVYRLLMQQLNSLEGSANPAIAVSAGLLRYITAVHMVNDLLPDGRDVTYRPDGDEQIPTIPVKDNTPESAITQASDAIVEEGNEDGRGELQTPFVPAARKFFLPQWVAFDDQGKLLVGSVTEAEAQLQSMQRYVMILHRALSLAPYISSNEEYQRKRYGILGQLINQGRSLANFKTNEIVSEIKTRVKKQSLNRGLSISLPYFHDQNLEMKQTNFEVIPAGRIMFIPAFVVRAVHHEQVKVSQDTRYNPSTRKHLLCLLDLLEQTFESVNQ